MARRRPLDCEWKRVNVTQHEIGSNNIHSNVQLQGTASRTRMSSKKRKLYELVPSSPTQGSEELEVEDHEPDIDLSSDVPSKPWIPEKRVLELILDTLQRRDRHEIFAEPVDPNEVEEYYEIIKEPMDFGTMRAKLHEGMYESLEQFERDIFLITKNAMYFNSSGSVYFREARVVDELAKEVFRVLKTRPESFELELLEPRLRTRPKLARNAKSNAVTIGETSKSVPSSSNTSPNIRKRTQFRRGISGFKTCFEAKKYCEASYNSGCDDSGSRLIESDKRYTYKPLTSSFDQNESNSSIMSFNIKQLEPVIQRNISYDESLMSFVKDLGPIIQAIARKKLVRSNFPIQNRPSTTDQFRSIINAPKQPETYSTSPSEKTEPKVSEKSQKANMIRENVQSKSAVLLASSLLARAKDSNVEVTNKPNVKLDRPSGIDFWENRSNSLSGFDFKEKDDIQESKPFGFSFSNSRVGQTNAFRRLAFLYRRSSSGF